MRGFIRREGRYAMIHSRKYGEYKFPGGGAKPWEQLEDTLLREVQEEAIANNERITDTEHIPWIVRDTLMMKALLQKEREGNGKE